MSIALRLLSGRDVDALAGLHSSYKQAIGEEPPTLDELAALKLAIAGSRILFYGCESDERLVGICSLSLIFSTFNYAVGGIFEDFYIDPAYRGQGIAKQLVRFAAGHSGVRSLVVGCADCDLGLYRALGFTARLGSMLAFDMQALREPAAALHH